MSVPSVEDQLVAQVVIPLAQVLLATIKARWGSVEQWEAEMGDMAGMLPAGWSREQVVDLLVIAEAAQCRGGPNCLQERFAAPEDDR